MAKSKTETPKSRPGAGSHPAGVDRLKKQDGDASSAKSKLGHMPSQAAIRETIESVVVAFVLAFLFRTFEAEAFVIPTGSMATTLMGRHKDLVCPMCGYEYQASASEEVNQDGSPSRFAVLIDQCICPMCRYTAFIGLDNPQEKTYPSYKGDRILVNKFSYDFYDPERWDVAVFRYPGGAKINFIKRLVGLPGETIRIEHGDIFVGHGDGQFVIARKPPAKLLHMLKPVFDNDFAPKIAAYFPPRWKSDEVAGGWKTQDNASFQTGGAAGSETWIRYRHLVPSQSQWQSALHGNQPLAEPLKPQLISDFSAYNTSCGANEAGSDLDSSGLHWVGDIALKCQLEVLNDTGEAVLELVEGGRRMQCRINVATGTATLSIDGLENFRPTAPTAVQGRRPHEVTFANVDDQLLLWVDDCLVQFDAPTTYDPLGNARPEMADLSPVGVASAGGAVLSANHLKVFRDLYYISEGGMGPGQFYSGNSSIISDYLRPAVAPEILANPGLWDESKLKPPAEFVLGEGQFLALGDNSAKSKDGRLWSRDGFDYFVDRHLLIGKALYIYWPHSWNHVPGTRIPFPFFPNFARMGFVR